MRGSDDILQRIKDHEGDPDVAEYTGDILPDAADEIANLRARVTELEEFIIGAPDKLVGNPGWLRRHHTDGKPLNINLTASGDAEPEGDADAPE